MTTTMASKKGVMITAIILGIITGASFLIWMIPENSETTFVVTNYDEYIDGVKNIHEILEESINIEYQNLINGKINPNEYNTIADVTTSQITSQISEFVTSKPPEKWQDSYINYMDAMKKFNTYVGETKVLADLIEKESTHEELTDTIEKIESLKEEFKELVQISDQNRPN